jgi:hypothetical protein
LGRRDGLSSFPCRHGAAFISGHDWYEVNVAHGFWVRRTVDSTPDESLALLTALLTTHDEDWLKAQCLGQFLNYNNSLLL